MITCHIITIGVSISSLFFWLTTPLIENKTLASHTAGLPLLHVCGYKGFPLLPDLGHGAVLC